jgi:4-hydroxybenzoate polyprenyltransferase
MLRGLVRSLRPAQWAKNSFVLAPVVFAGDLADPGLLARALAAFATFCAASSAVYLVNDLRDREQDRNHPLKRHRPIAAGTLPVVVAAAAALALAGGAVAAAVALDRDFTVALGAYLGLQLLYTLWFKRVVILDALAIALGFVLRVYAGAAAVAVEVSPWLLLCTIFLALFLAFSKRRHELVLLADSAASQRGVLAQYSPAFLDQMINVVTASTVVCYALYAVAPETTAKHGGRSLLVTVPLVLFGIFRYLYLVYQRSDERNPTEAILRDLPFLINVGLWGIAVLAIVYER